MALGTIAAGLAGLGAGLATGIYNIWSNERDFDYQKATQQEVWNREDNAVQRRMADLKAAGLNPNLAAGSAAGAGSVVGRSNTPSLSGNPVGTALDTASAVMQLRNQREENKILQNQKDISAYNADQAKWDNMINSYETMQLLGLKPDIKYNYNTGNYDIYTTNIPDKDNPLEKQLLYQLQNNKNAADLLQKDADWYTADKIANYVGTAGSLFSHAGSGFNSFTQGYTRRRR